MELWTREHALSVLPSLAVMLILGAVLRRVLKGQPRNVRMIPLQVLAVIFVVMEIGKQAVSASRGYDLYHIPLHFCSLFVFMLPLMAFYRGKHTQTVAAVTAALCASVFVMMLVYPNLIYSPGNVQGFFRDYLDFHTVAFHNGVLLAFILILALELHEPQPKGEPRAVALFILGYCAVASVAAQVLKTNYNNFYTCNIPPLEALRQTVQTALGAAAAQVMYVLIVIAVDLIFVTLAYWLYRLLHTGVSRLGAKSRQTYITMQ